MVPGNFKMFQTDAVVSQYVFFSNTIFLLTVLLNNIWIKPEFFLMFQNTFIRKKKKEPTFFSKCFTDCYKAMYQT